MNFHDIDIQKLSLEQLEKTQDSIDAFIFKEAPLFMKGEPYAPSYKKDQKHFRAIISQMVSFKRVLMGYFKNQYENRFNLIRMTIIKAAEDTDFDDDDEYFYNQTWDEENTNLANIIETRTQNSYDLGVASLLLISSLQSDHASTDPAAQDYLLKNAMKMAADINTTTRNRVLSQIKASLELQETRTQFDIRLKKVFVNPYRGRFIAQDQSLRTYLSAKDTAATEAGKERKTWIGPQAVDQVCGDVNEETVGLEENFSNGLQGPLAHFGCRCDLDYS